MISNLFCVLCLAIALPSRGENHFKTADSAMLLRVIDRAHASPQHFTECHLVGEEPSLEFLDRDELEDTFFHSS